MSKAANNERIKLRAVFYNNIAVGLTLAGVAIPGLAIFFKAYEFGRWTFRWYHGISGVDADTVVGIAAALMGIFFGLRAAQLLRRRADRELSQIKD